MAFRRLNTELLLSHAGGKLFYVGSDLHVKVPRVHLFADAGVSGFGSIIEEKAPEAKQDDAVVGSGAGEVVETVVDTTVNPLAAFDVNVELAKAVEMPVRHVEPAVIGDWLDPQGFLKKFGHLFRSGYDKRDIVAIFDILENARLGKPTETGATYEAYRLDPSQLYDFQGEAKSVSSINNGYVFCEGKVEDLEKFIVSNNIKKEYVHSGDQPGLIRISYGLYPGAELRLPPPVSTGVYDYFKDRLQ